jgi:hypothetical protein
MQTADGCFCNGLRAIPSGQSFIYAELRIKESTGQRAAFFDDVFPARCTGRDTNGRSSVSGVKILNGSRVESRGANYSLDSIKKFFLARFVLLPAYEVLKVAPTC